MTLVPVVRFDLGGYGMAVGSFVVWVSNLGLVIGCYCTCGCEVTTYMLHRHPLIDLALQAEEVQMYGRN